MKTPGFPIKFSKTPSTVERGAPLTGEHTREVLRRGRLRRRDDRSRWRRRERSPPQSHDRADAIAVSPGTTPGATMRWQRRPQRSIRPGTRFRSLGTSSRWKASSRTRSPICAAATIWSCSIIRMSARPSRPVACSRWRTCSSHDTLPTLQRRRSGRACRAIASADRHWALPLDAATQVMAARSDLLQGAPPPATWDEVVALSRQPARSRCRSPGRMRCCPTCSIARRTRRTARRARSRPARLARIGQARL